MEMKYKDSCLHQSFIRSFNDCKSLKYMQVSLVLLTQGQRLLGSLQCWNYYEALVS